MKKFLELLDNLRIDYEIQVHAPNHAKYPHAS